MTYSLLIVIARTRQTVAAFTAGQAITAVGGVPIGVGKGVIQGGGYIASGVGYGLGTVGGFAGRKCGLIKKKDKVSKEVVTDQVEEVADGIVSS
jgi:hypothetical protein